MLTLDTLHRLRHALAHPDAAAEIDDLLGMLPAMQLPGDVYFVDSTHTNTRDHASQPGSRNYPFATMDYADTRCAANKGDIVFVMPGHNEDLSDAQISLATAGVKWYGQGYGTYRPRIDFNHANASIDIAANNIQLHNIVLFPSVTDVLIGIDINAAVTDTLLNGIEAIPGEDGAGVDDFALGIDIKAGCTRTKIYDYKQRQHASGAGYIAGIRFTGASDDCLIVRPDIVLKGAAAVAPINGITTLSTNLDIIRGRLTSDDEPGIEVLTGTTGRIIDTDIFTDLATIAAATVADGMAHFRVRYVEVGNESDAVVKTASADD